MNRLIKIKDKSGHVQVVAPGAGGLKYISFDMLYIKNGFEYEEETGGNEVCLVILGGQCTVSAGGESWNNVGQRKDVFSGRAASFFIPGGNTFVVSGTSEGPCEMAVLRCRAATTGAPVYIPPEKVKVVERGKDNWSRTVHDIVDKDVPAGNMLVGETHSPAGNWSSAPPHCHDEDNPPHETNHEEIYLFKTDPPQGFQVIRLYTDDRSLDNTYTVEQDDTLIIDRGYHPVAAGPGYRGYYLWLLAGAERTVIPRDDPRHVWLKNA